MELIWQGTVGDQPHGDAKYGFGDLSDAGVVAFGLVEGAGAGNAARK